jgi:hydrogenase maturation protease
VTPRILVAGVGNIFRGDDAFGVEVVRRLAARPLPDGVRAADFGIRGHDLAYAILDGYDAVILVDAAARAARPSKTAKQALLQAEADERGAGDRTDRGEQPGTLYALELDPNEPAGPRLVEGHGIDLPAVFGLVRALGGTFPPVYLVGCEPAELGPDDEGAMGLSEPVAAAVEPAVGHVEALITELLAESGRA